MMKLTCKAQARAKAFIERHARPLEQRIYAHEFEHGPKEPIFEALAAFQNPDVGFGNALEPDLRLPDSSVLATTVGLQVLREFNAPADHPLVRGALRYLLQTYDPIKRLLFEPDFNEYEAVLPVLAEKLRAFAAFNGCDNFAVEDVQPEKVKSALVDALAA